MLGNKSYFDNPFVGNILGQYGFDSKSASPPGNIIGGGGMFPAIRQPPVPQVPVEVPSKATPQPQKPSNGISRVFSNLSPHTLLSLILILLLKKQKQKNTQEQSQQEPAVKIVKYESKSQTENINWLNIK